MDKLFEKLIIFMTLIIFMGFSYIVFHYNELQFTKHEDRHLESTKILELKAPDWFRDTIKPYECNDFSVVRLTDRFYVKCEKNLKTVYIRADFDDFIFKSGYLYEYNSESNILNLYMNSKNKNKLLDKKYEVINIINQDFLKYLDIELEKNEKIENGGFLLINKDEHFLMIK